ncbi:MAG: hypothetical protein H0X26_09635, partial [Alphaproteobacteria bacterium]|nr:hypothetical protein [Alphaproteobacteria bacterium]
WKEDTAPVGIFWRWGHWNNLTWYDHLTTASLDDISSKNLYENRCVSVMRMHDGSDRMKRDQKKLVIMRAANNFMFIFKSKEELLTKIFD